MKVTIKFFKFFCFELENVCCGSDSILPLSINVTTTNDYQKEDSFYIIKCEQKDFIVIFAFTQYNKSTQVYLASCTESGIK